MTNYNCISWRLLYLVSNVKIFEKLVNINLRKNAFHEQKSSTKNIFKSKTLMSRQSRSLGRMSRKIK